QPDELYDPDDRFGGAVDRGPPDWGGERVGVVDLGELLPGRRAFAAHYDGTPLHFMPDVGRLGAAGGSSSSRPASSLPGFRPPDRRPRRPAWRSAAPHTSARPQPRTARLHGPTR